MILDTLDNAARYDVLHPLFANAFYYLATADFAEMAAGRHDIAGDDLFVMVIRSEQTGRHEAILEAHRKYIDIHVTLSGTDEVGWRPLADCGDVKQDYNEAGDAILFHEQPQLYIPVATDSFAVLFPEDAHMAMTGEGALEKVVFKIAVMA